MSGTPIRSVCGILCGQRKSAKLHRFQKLQKSKENTRNPKISGVVLELLTRFELVTSSLPMANFELFTILSGVFPTVCSEIRYFLRILYLLLPLQ